jgi:hypothetical protein
MPAIVLGNGPSRTKGLALRNAIPFAEVHACNLIATADNPTYLYAVDPWVQFDIVSSEYKGACRFLDFDPIPADIRIEDVIYSAFPTDYDIKIHNPEHKATAIGWIFYHTGNTLDHFWNTQMRYAKDYWRPRRAYILYVPAGLNITVLKNMEYAKGQIAPTGAYALRGAIEDGHTEIYAYGFDSIVGEYATESRIDPQENKEEIRRGEHFIKYYDKIMDTFPDVNIQWCT